MYQHFLHVWFPLMKVRWLQGNEMQRMCAAAFFRCKHSWEFLQRWNTGGYLQHLVKLGSWNPNSSPSFSWKKTDVWWCVAMVHAHLMLNQQCIYDEVLWSRYPSESWASGQKFLYEPGPVAVPESASCGSGVDVQKPWCLLGSNQWVPLVHPGSSGLGDGNPKKSKSCDIDLLAFWPTAIFMCKWLCQGEKSCLFVRRFPVTPAFWNHMLADRAWNSRGGDKTQTNVLSKAHTSYILESLRPSILIILPGWSIQHLSAHPRKLLVNGNHNRRFQNDNH
jgi:hypothetical protein